jgi:hypothetical protein
LIALSQSCQMARSAVPPPGSRDILPSNAPRSSDSVNR